MAEEIKLKFVLKSSQAVISSTHIQVFPSLSLFFHLSKLDRSLFELLGQWLHTSCEVSPAIYPVQFSVKEINTLVQGFLTGDFNSIWQF